MRKIHLIKHFLFSHASQPNLQFTVAAEDEDTARSKLKAVIFSDAYGRISKEGFVRLTWSKDVLIRANISEQFFDELAITMVFPDIYAEEFGIVMFADEEKEEQDTLGEFKKLKEKRNEATQAKND